jgi:hypothetical protein
MDERVRTGIHVVWTIVAGCKLEQFEASRHRGRSGRKVLITQTDDALDSWASEW